MTPLFFFCPHWKTPFFLYLVCHRKTPTLGVVSAHPSHFHMSAPRYKKRKLKRVVPILTCILTLNWLTLTPKTHFVQFYLKVASYFLSFSLSNKNTMNFHLTPILRQIWRRSLAHKFTVNAPLLCPLFSISRKVLHFQPCFDQNSSSLDLNFSKFSFPRPSFF